MTALVRAVLQDGAIRTARFRRLLAAIAAVIGVAVLLGAASVEAAGTTNSRVLRVCADPDNMPFSNDKGEGFENKLAELMASKLEAKLEYTWFPEDTGYIPNTMGSAACDLVMGYAQGTGLIEDSNPYYFTSYVLITRQDDADLAGVERLSDPRLKDKRIGLFARTPPASILAMYGHWINIKPFEIRGSQTASKAALAIIAEIERGELDAGLLWGPVGGYYAARAAAPLTVVPLVKELAGPRTIYDITMGVRPNEPQWKHQINKVISENQAEINAILESYHVPLLNQEGKLIELGAAER